MLSILIPTYNYDCTNLVKKLVEQGQKLKISFEVIVFDDASTKRSHLKALYELKNQIDFTVIEGPKNLGRLEGRKHLAQSSNYEWLLFLDSDVMPVSDSFLKIYCEHITASAQFLFGGVCYTNEKPPKTKLLHWTYGKYREERSLKTRKAKPYTSIVSANFMIKKQVFLDINPKNKKAMYGRSDIILVKSLKDRQTPVEHIENPVFHLGLEDTQIYINKHLEAIDALIVELNSGDTSITERPLVKTYLKLKRLSTTGLYRKTITNFIPAIERNLFSNKPSMRFFDFYRLYHFIKKMN